MKPINTRWFTAAIASLLIAPPINAQTMGGLPKLNDVDNTIVKALSSSQNISDTQSRRSLRLMTAIGQLSANLRKQFPDKFAGIVLSRDSSPTLTVFLKDGGNSIAQKSLLETGLTADELPSIIYKTVKYSAKDKAKIASDALASMNAAGIVGEVSTEDGSDILTLNVRDVDATNKAIKSGVLKVPDGTSIKQFGGIIPTAGRVTQWPGGVYFNTHDAFQCTTGFNVRTSVNNAFVFGPLNAGHCDIYKTGVDNSKVDAYAYGTYDNPSYLYAKVQHARVYVNDVQAFYFVNQSSDLAKPGFYDGNAYVQLTGVVAPYSGQFVCKFGRTTLKSCGFVEAAQFYDTYGAFYKVNVTPQYTKQSSEGDSGGPVYQNTAAVGIVHGRDAQYNLYFASICSLGGVDIVGPTSFFNCP